MPARPPIRSVRSARPRRGRATRARALAAAAVLTLSAASCSLVGSEGAGGDGSASTTVVLLTHDSFSLPKQVVADFEEESGYQLEVESVGDGGTLTNQLVLTQGDPLGDVAFGVDNTFASAALDADVFAPDDSETTADLPAGVEQYQVDDPTTGEPTDALTPVDASSVCVNVDDAWFDEQGLEPPQGLDDLTDPAYRGLFVTPGATSSTPGMAFLLATIAQYGDDWPDYWADLMANDAKVVKGWEDAYTVDFTASGGDRPIVLSYDSSPAFTVEDGETTTSALLDTCFRQVEYVGVLEGAANPDGARALVEFMLGEEVQRALPTSMYVFPVVDGVRLPRDWARFAEQPTDPLEVDPADVAANRQDWLEEWTDVTTR